MEVYCMQEVSSCNLKENVVLRGEFFGGVDKEDPP